MRLPARLRADLSQVVVLESYIGITLSLGLDPSSPSPGQRVITHEAAGMKKLWESYEKTMKNIARPRLESGTQPGSQQPDWHPAQELVRGPWISIWPGS